MTLPIPASALTQHVIALGKTGSVAAKSKIAILTGYAPDGGGFNNALSRLRTLELIERRELKASEVFFS